MKFNKAVILMLGLITLLAVNCAPKNQESKDQEARNEFLNQYSTRGSYDNGHDPRQRSSSLVIRDDGSIRFESKSFGDRCTLRFDGRIESVTLSQDYYNVRYRFHKLTPFYPRCSAQDSRCAMDVADCERAVRDYQKRLGEGHSIIVKKGTHTDAVIMMP